MECLGRTLRLGQHVAAGVAEVLLGGGFAAPRAVDARRGAVDHARPLVACRFERIDRALHVHAERLHGQYAVVAQARGRREVVYFVAPYGETLGYVVLHVAERVVRAYVGQQRRVGRIAYVHAEYFVAVGEQPPAEVRADESGAAQYHDSFSHPDSFLEREIARIIP